MKESPPPILRIPFQEDLAFDMVYVGGGEFLMGDDDSPNNDEKPAHPVKLDGFYIGKYPVTQQLWQAVMGENPSYFKGENRPVEMVSWAMAKDFNGKLTNRKEVKDFFKKFGFSVDEFRLPSEAEWEYAARGDRHSEGFGYAGSNHLDEVAWYRENSYNETKAVGLKYPNELGLYDMSGNVWEWCEDDWHSNYENAPDDGSAWVDSPKRGRRRVQRGGGYFDYPGFCRAAYRYRWNSGHRYDDFGFRLALSPSSAREQKGAEQASSASK